MPSGKTHDKVTWFFLPPLTFMFWDFSRSILITTLFSISFIFSALMFSGDLDLVSSQSKRWGILKWIWIPYRKMMAHRSAWSHGILLGTVFRIFYLSVVIILFYTIFYFITSNLSPDLNKDLVDNTKQGVVFLKSKNPLYFIIVFMGLVAGAASHTLADESVSLIKRLLKKKKRKASKVRNKK